MQSTQYYVAASIDGFIADEHDRLDWLLQFDFAHFQTHYDEFLRGVGAIVMGSTTYEYILGMGLQEWTYGTTPVFVLTSRELPGVRGADLRFVRGDVAAVHADALDAAEGRNVWLMGGGDVVAQFADLGLLDELLLTVVPVVLGSGKRLLPLAAATSPLELVSTTAFPRGAVGLAYRFPRAAGSGSMASRPLRAASLKPELRRPTRP
jgi:dihydrofolate reductase